MSGGFGSQNPTRRDAIKWIGGGAAALAAGYRPSLGQASGGANASELVPADKKLDPQWRQSLFARGRREIYRGRDLKFIGMPVGGIAAGQLYLGGDGRLWHWDVFNHFQRTKGEHYRFPPAPASPIRQGFSLISGGRSRPLDATGFSDVSFRGEYPIGIVEYRDPSAPAVTLEAFSPFIPLDVETSSLPATILQFTVRNTTGSALEASLSGEMENAICQYSPWAAAARKIDVVHGKGLTFLNCSVDPAAVTAPREIIFEDWSRFPLSNWTRGESWRSRQFKIEDPFINFEIGASATARDVILRLVIDGRAARTAIAREGVRPLADTFDVAELAGQTGHFEIVIPGQMLPQEAGVGPIRFGDRPQHTSPTEVTDYGTMGLGLLGSPAESVSGPRTAPLSVNLTGRIDRALHLAPGQTAVVTFVLTWHFPNLFVEGLGRVGRHYATRFPSAFAVADHVSTHIDRLGGQTRLWRDTWYDSTLPYWFLDRTMINTSTLATSTCHRFADGRFYGWEGADTGPGTCTHVWGYAQAMGRLFPPLERDIRERTNYGLAFGADGRIAYRGELSVESVESWAVDGQAMIILSTLREHQMSADDRFLRRVWPRAKKALQALMAADPGGRGILAGRQHNTLDVGWYGEIAWLSGLYLAALLAGGEMALELGDATFAGECREIAARGRAALSRELFNGEYYINRIDPAHREVVNSGSGCLIDQVLGQSWAFQVGLGRVFPESESRSALRSIWRYNFATDVGPFRAANQPGRWFALSGEGGLILCTFPRSDWDMAKASSGDRYRFSRYFNETWSGCEHQVAAHMLWEGLVLEGLAVIRTVHDRYAASRRNPWNEAENGDHYARALSSYGVYLAACGFEYHGPRRHLAFAPRLTPENFRCAFTAAEGWGTFSQQIEGSRHSARIAIGWGRLPLKTLGLARSGKGPVSKIKALLAGREIGASLHAGADRHLIEFSGDTVVSAGEELELTLNA